MTKATPRRLKRFACGPLGQASYLKHPGDGRLRPQIPAHVLLWALVMGQILREWSFLAVEALVRSPARRNLGVAQAFGDDALGYFTERMDPSFTRRALASILKRAKRNKAFEASRFLGLALDGTTTSLCTVERCPLCQPQHEVGGRLLGYGHKLSLISLVGGPISLPFDVEPYGPGDSELAASRRLLERAVEALGPRFINYVVADGLYAAASLLNRAQELGLWILVRLKGNVPHLQQAVEDRFRGRAPSQVFEHHGDRIELWDAEDFDPWDTLRWSSVRVLRYRQHKPDGTVIEADWLTNAPTSKAGSRALYHMAKSRWQVENQGFNDAKSRHGMEHLCHHHENSLLMEWLLILFALALERLYRLRHLHRGTHPSPTAIEFVRALRLSLGAPQALNSS